MGGCLQSSFIRFMLLFTWSAAGGVRRCAACVLFSKIQKATDSGVPGAQLFRLPEPGAWCPQESWVALACSPSEVQRPLIHLHVFALGGRQGRHGLWVRRFLGGCVELPGQLFRPLPGCPVVLSVGPKKERPQRWMLRPCPESPRDSFQFSGLLEDLVWLRKVEPMVSSMAQGTAGPKVFQAAGSGAASSSAGRGMDPCF